MNPKFNKGDIIQRKYSGKQSLIKKIDPELKYYTLSDPNYPNSLQSADLSIFHVDAAYELVRHMDAEEFKEAMNRILHS